MAAAAAAVGSGRARHLDVEGRPQGRRKARNRFAQMYLVLSRSVRQPAAPSGHLVMSHAELDRPSLAARAARSAAMIVLPAAVAALAACASKPVAPPAPATASSSSTTTTTTAPAPAAAPAPQATELAAYLDPNSPISQRRSVFFNFDESSFIGDDKAVIQLQGDYLARHPEVHVRVEGNTDERGSDEYNLALGQRRAQAVVSAMELVGAKSGQMEAVSYGKEKPKATGHDEQAWAQNRRADVVYPSH
jgi:peptidoglycan-associated lipoprotein